VTGNQESLHDVMRDLGMAKGFDVKDYLRGFEAMVSGKSGKVVLDWA
jgi:hypothetical protein